MIDEFRIQKVRVPVVILTVDDECVFGDVFVEAIAPPGRPRETVLDVLNQDEPFLPVANAKGGTLLLARAQIREVRPARGTTFDTGLQFGTPTSVSVRMAGGSRRHGGTMVIEQPTGRQRVQDSLNRLTDRFLLLQGEDGVVLLNRVHIVHVSLEG